MGVWSRYVTDQAQSRLSGKIDLQSLAIDAWFRPVSSYSSVRRGRAGAWRLQLGRLPYVSAKFGDVPFRKASEAADGLRLNEVSFLENLALSALKCALAAGVPFVFGIDVNQTPESPIAMQTGLVCLPVNG